MARARKGDTVKLGNTPGTVVYTGVNKLFIDFGEGFTCLLPRRMVTVQES